MIYLAVTSNYSNPKNNLQAAISEHVKTLNRLMIPDERMEQFKEELKQKTEELNALHPRCKKEEVRWHEARSYDLDPSCFVGGMNIKFYETKTTY